MSDLFCLITHFTLFERYKLQMKTKPKHRENGEIRILKKLPIKLILMCFRYIQIFSEFHLNLYLIFLPCVRVVLPSFSAALTVGGTFRGVGGHMT